MEPVNPPPFPEPEFHETPGGLGDEKKSITEIAQRAVQQQEPSLSFWRRVSRSAWRLISLAGTIISGLLKDAFTRSVHSVIRVAGRIFHSKGVTDPYKLLRGDPIRGSEEAWAINLALLREAEKATSDPAVLKKIHFLQANYLKKAAPIYIQYMRLINPHLESRFQVTPFVEALYHRQGFRHQLDLGADKLNKSLAEPKKFPLILTDTSDFTQLLPLSFSTESADPLADGHEDRLITALIEHCDSHPENPLQCPLDKALLFDATARFQELIHTDGDSGKEARFQKEFRKYQQEVNDRVEVLSEALIHKYPSLSPSEVRKFIQKNITCICRVDFAGEGDLSGIKILPLFGAVKQSELEKTYPVLFNFIESTGLYVNTMTMRRHLLDEQAQSVDIHYVRSSDEEKQRLARYFPTRESLCKTNLFTMLSAKFASQEYKAIPHISILGTSTLQLLKGLLGEISEERWESLNRDPATCQVLQNSLFKIANALASANLHLQSFDQFAQDIELIHYEMTTLLELARPFPEGQFSEIYGRVIEPCIPKALGGNVHIGLGKTAVNVFSGVNAALLKTNPHPVRVYSEGVYFEEAGVIHRRFEDVLHDESVERVDLYCGQFNPNVEIDSDFTHYRQRDVEKDISDLLAAKPKIEHLTVSIDCTIDSVPSEKITHLLQTFEKEIKSGKLNFIFLKSGQKLDMFGMDNYFGAPFYIVNNGSDHWKEYNALPTTRVHQTDSLSHQWFCLANKYASDSLNDYRARLFENSKMILSQIPPALLPDPSKPKQKIRVCTVDDAMEPSFIDVKVRGAAHQVRAFTLLGLLYKKCEDRGIKIHSKASFGFYHINGIVISADDVPHSSTIRINPSIHPEENEVILEFLRDLAEA